MSLESLQVRNIRNLTDVSIELHPTLNLFLGNNGSGKTSLLESVYLLATGRSFRHQQLEPLIQRSAEDCTVFAGVMLAEGRRSRLGMRRVVNGARELRINGETVQRASAFAAMLPSLVLGPNTVDLLVGAPGGRRRFLNHGVFHVEQDFSQHWFEGNRYLKQRNQVLKQGGSLQELKPWNEGLVMNAELIHQGRQKFIDQITPVFTDICHFLSGLKGVKCRYSRGWDAKRSLHDVLEEQRQTDQLRGYTQAGFQRADIRITVEGQPAAATCSRGELKILSWALMLSQGMVIRQNSQHQPVYLVDDLGSELDKEHREKVCQALISSAGQILATGTDLNTLVEPWVTHPHQRFHVEHGRVNRIEVGESE